MRSVEAGGPADKAGVEAGDIITKFNGQTIETRDRPAAHGRRHQAGHARRRCTVWRKGADARPAGHGRRDSSRSTGREGRAGEDAASRRQRASNALGLAVSDLTDDAEEGAEDQGRRAGRCRRRRGRARRHARRATSSCASATPRSRARSSSSAVAQGRQEQAGRDAACAAATTRSS